VATLLRAEKLTKSFRTGNSNLVVLDALDFAIEAGEMIAVVGESGSGKSTLLHTMGALDKPTSGELYFDGKPYSRLSEAETDSMRNREFGFVWQMHCLLPEFTARENVMMPLLIRGMKKQEAGARAEQWLDRVGLSQRTSHRAGELSGGEQQRVALARALITEPRLLMADEPTGNLDAKTGEETIGLMQRLHSEGRLTTIVVTHHAGLAQRCDRVLRLESGRLQAVSLSPMT
jgi:lipoprotein-releasing system ATP-binding protein